MSYRIGIIGVGSIGSVVGGMLTKAGHDVTLIDQWPEHVDAMRKIGFQYLKKPDGVVVDFQNGVKRPRSTTRWSS